MSSIQSIESSQDYVNYTFNLTSRGITETTSELAGMSSTITNLVGLMAFKTAEYLSSTESLIVSFGYAATAVFSTATQQAIRFQQALADVKAIGGESINEIAIGQAAMKYSNKFGMNVDSMTEGLEALSRAGLTATDVMSGVLEEGVKLSKLEGMDLEDSINNLISTTNLLATDEYDVNSQEYAEMVKQMNQHIVSTSESAPINAQNIIQSLQHVGGYASANQIDQEDLFAVIAQLGAKGTKGEMAGTALRAFIAAGQKDQAQRALNRIGLDVSDLWSENGDMMLSISEMKDVLDEALEARGYSKQEKLEFYSDFAGYKQANQIMKINTTEVQQYKESIAQAWDLGRKLDEILGTVNSNIQIIAQTTKNFLTKVGQTALPMINAVLQPIKWAVQIIDALPFSENIVGIGLTFLALKGLFVGINRVVPAIVSLASPFKSSEKSAKNIAGHFKNIKNDAKEAVETLKHLGDSKWMASKRLENDKFGMGSFDRTKAISAEMFNALNGPEIYGVKNFQDLSNYQQNHFSEIVSSIGGDTQLYQSISTRLSEQNQNLIEAIENLESTSPRVHGGPYRERFETPSGNDNRTRNYEVTQSQKGFQEVKEETKTTNTLLNSTKSTIDETNRLINSLKTHIASNTSNSDQYDIGRGIMSVAQPLSNTIADAIYRRFNQQSFNTQIGKIQLDKDIGAGAAKELNKIFDDVRKNISDLPDISFHYDNDIEKMQDKMKSLRKEISNVAEVFSNVDINNMNQYQGRRAIKSVDVKAMGKIGIQYSEMMNEAYIREVLNQNSFDKNNKFIEKIYDEQIDLLAKSLDIDIYSGLSKIQKMEKIYHTFQSKKDTMSIDDVINTSTKWYHNSLDERIKPSEAAAKWLDNDAAKYIMETVGIDYNKNQNNASEQLQAYFSRKDADLETQWVVRQLVFAIQKSQASGVYSGPETDELRYMIEHLEALNQSINRLNSQIMGYNGAITGKSLIDDWIANANLPPSNFKQRYDPTLIEDSVKDFILNGNIIFDKTLPTAGVSLGGNVVINDDSKYEDPNERFQDMFRVYIHEMAHSVLNHQMRQSSETMNHQIPLAEYGKINELEARLVEESISKYLGINTEAQAYQIGKYQKGIEERGHTKFIAYDLVEETVNTIKQNLPLVISKFVNAQMNSQSMSLNDFMDNTQNYSLPNYQPMFYSGNYPKIDDPRIEKLDDEIYALEEDKKPFQKTLNNPDASPGDKGWAQDQINEIQEQIDKKIEEKTKYDIENREAHGLIPENNFFDVVVRILNTINDNVAIIGQYISGDKRTEKIKSLPSKIKTFTDNEIDLHRKEKEIEKVKNETPLNMGYQIGGGMYYSSTPEEMQNSILAQQENAKKQSEQEQQRKAEQERIKAEQERIKRLKDTLNEPDIKLDYKQIHTYLDYERIQKDIERQQHNKKIAKSILEGDRVFLEAINNEVDKTVQELTGNILGQSNVRESKLYYAHNKTRINQIANDAQALVSPTELMYNMYGGKDVFNRNINAASTLYGMPQRKPPVPEELISLEERKYMGRGYGDYIFNMNTLQSQGVITPETTQEEQKQPTLYEMMQKATDVAEGIMMAERGAKQITAAYSEWYEETLRTDTIVDYHNIALQDVITDAINGIEETFTDIEDIQKPVMTFYASNAQYSQYITQKIEQETKEKEKQLEALKEQGRILAEQMKIETNLANEYIERNKNNEYINQMKIGMSPGRSLYQEQNPYSMLDSPLKEMFDELVNISNNSSVWESLDKKISANILDKNKRDAEIELADLLLQNRQIDLTNLINNFNAPPIDTHEDYGYRQYYLSTLKEKPEGYKEWEKAQHYEEQRPFFKEHASSMVKDDITMELAHIDNLIASIIKDASLREQQEKINKVHDILMKARDASDDAKEQQFANELIKRFDYMMTLYDEYDYNAPGFISDEEALNERIKQEEKNKQLQSVMPDVQWNDIPEYREYQEVFLPRILNEIPYTLGFQSQGSSTPIFLESLSDRKEDRTNSQKTSVGIQAPNTENNIDIRNKEIIKKIKEANIKIQQEEQEELIKYAESILDNIRFSFGFKSKDTLPRVLSKVEQADIAAEKVIIEQKTKEREERIRISNLRDKEERERLRQQRIDDLKIRRQRERLDEMEKQHEENWIKYKKDILEKQQKELEAKLEQERIDNIWESGDVSQLSPEEFNRKLEEEENYAKSKKGQADAAAERVRKNNERERIEQEQQEFTEYIISILDTLKYTLGTQLSTMVEINEAQEDLLNINVEAFNNIDNEIEEIRKKYQNKRTDDFWAEQDRLEAEGIEENKKKQRQQKVAHADEAAKQVKVQQIQQELLGINVEDYNNYEVDAANRKQERERAKREKFWNDVQKEEEGYIEALEMAQQVAPQMLETMKHQLGVVTTIQDDIINEAIKNAQEGKYSYIQGVSAGVLDEEEKERIQQQYSHISGVGVNPEYEGLSFIEREKMKLDHKYGKEQIPLLEEDENGVLRRSDKTITRKQSLGERVERWSVRARAKVHDTVNNIPDKSEDAAILRERIGGVHEKLTSIIGPMEGFNNALYNAAEIFPPLSGVAWGFNTALEFMYGIQAALEFMQLLLNSEKFVEVLVNTGLISSETAVNIAKATETGTTYALTGAIIGLEAILSGPLLIVIAAIVALIAVVYLSEKNHAEALKENKKALEESNKSMNAALANYKSLHQARLSATSVGKQRIAQLKESIALRKLEIAREKRLSEVRKKAALENDLAWGETGSLRADMQTGRGLGGYLGFLSPIAKLAAGEYEPVADKHSENIYQTMSIIDETQQSNFLTDLITGHNSSYGEEIQYYQKAHAQQFAQMDAFAPQLQKLYDVESRAQQIYGVEGARDSQMFKQAMQEVANDTGLNGETLGQYLDYMQAEANVENARTLATSEFGEIQSKIQAEAMRNLYGDTGEMGDMDSLQDTMLKAMVEDEARKAKRELFEQSMLEISQAIYSAMRLDLGTAGKHMENAKMYLDGMQTIDENKVRILQESRDIAEENLRKDYETGPYSIYGDTPFGGAIESAHAAGMSVPNYSGSSSGNAAVTTSNTNSNLNKASSDAKSAANTAKQLIDKSKSNLEQNKEKVNENEGWGLGDVAKSVIGGALNFAKKYDPLVGAISAFFPDTEHSEVQPTVNKYEIKVEQININTEDDPEKIKSALMNLIIEMQEQITPRQVSRTIGELPTQVADAATNMVEGVDNAVNNMADSANNAINNMMNGSNNNQNS